jgi:hypothetical protein
MEDVTTIRLAATINELLTIIGEITESTCYTLDEGQQDALRYAEHQVFMYLPPLD